MSRNFGEVLQDSDQNVDKIPTAANGLGQDQFTFEPTKLEAASHAKKQTLVHQV